jgi:hypothetical protein
MIPLAGHLLLAAGLARRAVALIYLHIYLL